MSSRRLPFSPSGLGLVALLLAGLPGQAQDILDRPEPAPSHKLSPRELDRREALLLYGKGLALQHRSRMLQALQALEKAWRLDPDSPAIGRALFSVYLALDQREQALTTAQQVLELDPADAETAYQVAQQLKSRGKTARAVVALRQAADSPRSKERPALRLQVLLDLAALHEDDENWTGAHKRLRQAADLLDDRHAPHELGMTRSELRAQAATVHEQIAGICLKQGKPEEAIAAFQDALHADPSQQARLSFHLAQVLAQQGHTEQALARVEDFLRSRPQGMESYDLKIKLQRKLGQEDQVVPGLEAAVHADPHNTSLKLLLGRELVRAGQLRPAEQLYTALLESSPTPEAYEGLFALYRQDTDEGAERLLTRFDDAIKKALVEEDDKKKGDPVQAAHARAMLAALRKDPELVGRLLAAAHVHLLRGEKPALQTRTLLASLAAGTQHLKTAEELYRSCLERPGGPGSMEQAVYAGLLQVLELQHRYADVATFARQGLQQAQHTHRVLFHRYLASACLALHQVDRALEAADNAVKDSDDSTLLSCSLLRAGMLSSVGKHDQAIAACQELLKKYNQADDVHRIRHRLSSIYSAAHDYPRAEDQLLRVLQSDPRDATASNDLGYLYAEQNKKLEEAERLVRKALDLDQQQRTSGTEVRTDSDHDNAAYIDSLGWVLFRQGRLDEARRELERATALPEGEDDPVVWDHLGDVYFRLHKTVRAEQAWKKSLELFDLGTRYPDERLQDIRQKLRLLASPEGPAGTRQPLGHDPMHP